MDVNPAIARMPVVVPGTTVAPFHVHDGIAYLESN